MVHFADTRNTCYYDVDRDQYVAYVRIWEANPQQPDMVDKYTVGWGGVGRRAIGRAVSDDFRHFSKAEIVIATSADMAPSHLWYNNAKTTLPGCPDQHVMFPWRWEMERDGGDTFLFSTNDGWAWSRVPGGPVLECGPVGGPDGEYVVASGELIELPDGRWAVPYHGYSVPHKYPAQNPKTRTGLVPRRPPRPGLRHLAQRPPRRDGVRGRRVRDGGRRAPDESHPPQRHRPPRRLHPSRRPETPRQKTSPTATSPPATPSSATPPPCPSPGKATPT